MEDYYLSDIRVFGLSNNRNEQKGPVHLQLSNQDSQGDASMRFNQAVFQSARILAKEDLPHVKESVRSYQPMKAPSIELVYLSKKGDCGVSATILFHKSGPSVICYSKSNPQKQSNDEPIQPIKALQGLCIGYENRYSYFTLPHVEKNCQI
ncbi:hypothetical protein JOC85_003324 [Bacillus mesophilus]|uniref:Uncharacterized protein n=1 Tax=Bacillus mesophilus TaxID=1808955 RepID=A0A6M0QAS9_9BACI|nr:hypothetical protein [Bacillus mesophilus]MBM7662517.1 hypothetical protein [Bacillus mesophilus]NEY72859.1 hypothetical protein [Bacillus mesophilus]